MYPQNFNGNQSSEIDSTDVAKVISTAASWAIKVAEDNTRGYSNDENERYFQNGEISSTGIVLNAYNSGGVPILDDWWSIGHPGMLVAGTGAISDDS